ncbi:hypothetical protein P7K49_028641 [Saguinus oedipus]|uniref:Uncharacterized protein n=1 Tax=Saguinus oedipus TaxID=9490 RepID=A0ABQ9U4X7_SAGOE|nr:hypothetical protein P7K49_028641 [Saguinus oedipus]
MGTQASLLLWGHIQGLETTPDTFPGRATSEEEGATQRSKSSGSFARGAATLGGDPGLFGGGEEAGPQAVEWPPLQPMGTSPPCAGARPSRRAVLTFPTSALPMEMTLMRRDLPGSFRFGMLASMTLALSGQPASVSPCARLARPSGLLVQWRTRFSRHRLGLAARHPRRCLAAGAGGWERWELREGGGSLAMLPQGG